MVIFYYLKNKEIYGTDDIKIWGEMRKENSKEETIGRDEICGCLISTVFLGINHNHSNGLPILFETMVFSEEHKELDERQERYCSWQEAKEGHEKMVEYVTKYCGEEND